MENTSINGSGMRSLDDEEGTTESKGKPKLMYCDLKTSCVPIVDQYAKGLCRSIGKLLRPITGILLFFFHFSFFIFSLFIYHFFIFHVFITSKIVTMWLSDHVVGSSPPRTFTV